MDSDSIKHFYLKKCFKKNQAFGKNDEILLKI